MAEQTHISWADATFNPWIGCTKVSPACDGCYAEHLMANRHGRVQWGKPGQRATYSRTVPGNWLQPLRWNKRAEKEGTRPFVFCSSLADVFDNQVDWTWRQDLFKLIDETPHLVWLLLTKRPQNIIEMVEAAGGMPSLASNVAFGTTIEDQARANRNGNHLLFAGAALNPLFLFYSCEPLLELTEPPLEGHGQKIGWVITGGETDQGSHKARPTHPNWYRSLRDRCAAAGIPYHHKQNGEWLGGDQIPEEEPITSGISNDCGYGSSDDNHRVWRVGKARSGRMLDGVTHDARPEVPAL